MWNKIKIIAGIVVAALSAFLGARLNQAGYDREKVKDLEKQLKKDKEADDEADKKKQGASLDNIDAKLNEHFK
jgi:uncharacterized membrane protein (DUF106 family)